MKAIISDIVLDGSTSRLAAALLMLICVRGMRNEDVLSLTVAMSQSGETFDYRIDASLKGARLVRRYPTGALSEKTALILPALIVCAKGEVSVCSPFLVARSLGYTGGTWDKLSAIEGFTFPEPGEDTIQTLCRCGVAMTVTKANANPADRILYSLRSSTGTVESGPLIVSSIASKQMCFPVHRLLLDVRYGAGAFLSSISQAKAIGDDIQKVLCAHGVPTLNAFTDTAQPTGSSIGNALEVAEAIAVMNGPNECAWDPRGIEEQRQIVIKFFAQLMAAEFPELGSSEWERYASKQIEHGEALRAFGDILLAHRVQSSFVERLFVRPLEALSVNRTPVDVHSRNTGTLRHLNQRRLGEIVNRQLGAGGNQFEGEFDPKPGVTLVRRLGDEIQQRDILCRIFADRELALSSIDAVRDCFTVT
jgi:pyrimidine-nucleoside phosphorylase